MRAHVFWSLVILAVGCRSESAPGPAPAPSAGAPRGGGHTPTSARALLDRLVGMADRRLVEADPTAWLREEPLEAPRLTARAADGQTLELALAHTSVTAQIAGNVARVEVQQLFQNPSRERLEAVYAFPLPENAAVTDMLFRVRDRVVVSEVRRRAEARRVYEQARDEGKTAALTEQERPNLFTQSVANIPPGESVEVVLRYVHEVPFDDGRYRFVFPTTIGPRYVPAHGVKDAERVTPPVVAEGFRSAHDLELAVELVGEAGFTDVKTRSHRIVTAVDRARGVRLVTLAPDDRIPNKDFVLSYRPAGREPDARVVLGRDRLGDYAMLLVQPPAEVAAAQVRARQLVFLVDKSGSMMGQPLETAKQVIVRALRSMGPDDTFQLVAFDSSTTRMSEEALAATMENVAAAERWLASLQGSGGTEMLSGIRAALDLPADPRRLRMVVFLTDGFIGNETEIIEHIRDGRGEARVFGFGIGTSVNRYLIEGVARAGRGAAEYVTLGERPDEAVTRLYRRLDRPVLTDLAVRWDGVAVSDVLPERMPDLFAGQPLVLIGRVRAGGTGALSVTLTGRLGQTPWSRTLPVDRAEGSGLLGTLWARRRIEDLMDRRPYEGPNEAEKEEIIQLALSRKLVTPYTSFVAVEKKLLVDPKLPLTQLLVPNEMPEGVSHGGIFGGGETSATVTPARVKPGDPEIRVRAPADARAVRVTLPFGGPALEAVRDPATGERVARFLVPPGWPDGSYEARIEVVRGDGTREVRTAPIRVDTAAPEVALVSAPERVRRGGEARLGFKPALPLGRVGELLAAPRPGGLGQALKGEIDLKEVLVRAPWGEVARAEIGGALGTYEVALHVPEAQPRGPVALEVIAVDAAGNVSRRHVPLVVGEPLERASVWVLGLVALAGALWLRRRAS